MTASAVYRVEMIHVGTGPGLPVVSRVYEFGGRYVAVPSQCLDCNGQPETVPADHGCQAALLLIHDPGCPSLAALVRQDEGAA